MFKKKDPNTILEKYLKNKHRKEHYLSTANFMKKNSL